MKKLTNLYQRNELLFALLWIGAYVLLFSLADGISESIGVQKILTAPFAVLMSYVLLRWIRKSGLSEKYGLCSAPGTAKRALWYLPMLLLVSVNLWGGISMRTSAVEALLYVITMFGVGFLEEVIFRGLLFRSMQKDGLVSAIIVSSVTFGFGHIVNLLNGADFVPTLLQTLYATSIGYLFTMLFYRTGTLLPCIVTHGIFNSLSVFGAERGTTVEIAAMLTLIALPILYASWIGRKDWLTEQAAEDSGELKMDVQETEGQV